MRPAYTYRHRVTFDETNLVGNVYFAHYLHWQGHCREHFLADHAPGVLAALGEDLALVTVACDIEFYVESRALDVIEVCMRLDRIAGHRITMGFDYQRLEPHRDLLARGHQTVATMRRAGATLAPVPVPVPQQLRAALAPYQAEPV